MRERFQELLPAQFQQAGHHQPHFEQGASPFVFVDVDHPSVDVHAASWGDSSTVEVHRLWHGSWELDPLESLEVQLPDISQNHLSIVAPTHEHIIFYLHTAVASSGCWEADFLVRLCGDLLPGVGFQVVGVDLIQGISCPGSSTSQDINPLTIMSNFMSVPLLWHVTGHIVWLQLDPFPGVEVQLVEISAVNVASCSSKHVETPVDDGHGLAVDAVGFLAAAAEQGPPLVLDVADVDVVPVALSKGDPGAPKHQEVVAM